MKTLVKRTPNTFRGIPSLLDEIFNDSWTNKETTSRSFTPRVNILEDDEAFALEFAVPGFSKKDITINLEDNVLAISSEVKTETEESNKIFNRKEFSLSSFKRSFTLPDTIESENISAKHENGILTVSLPKKEEAKPQPPKAIAIK